MIQLFETLNGYVRGTAPYLSPEAFLGAYVDERGDLYSLAALTYELLTGAPPFGAGDFKAISTAMIHWEIPPLPPETDDDLRELTLGLLSYDPGDRMFESASDALAWLDERAQPVASADELARPVERSGMGRAATELVEDRPPEHTQQLYAPVIFEGASSRQEEPDREGQKRPRWMIPLLVATACIGSAAGGLVLGIQSAAERAEREPGISADRGSEHATTSETARPPQLSTRAPASPSTTASARSESANGQLMERPLGSAAGHMPQATTGPAAKPGGRSRSRRNPSRRPLADGIRPATRRAYERREFRLAR